MKRVDCIIIGAGITGLTAAFRLQQSGKSVMIIEKENRVGGQIHSSSERGFIFESGPNTGVLSNPEVVELFEDISPDAELQTAQAAAKCRLVWKGDKFHALPSGMISGVTTPLFSFGDKLRVLGEPFRKKGTNPNESVGELAERRLGKSIVDYAVDPFISGIYAGDPYSLTTRYALPKLYNLEQQYGGFIKGTIGKAKLPKSEREKRATKDIFSAKGGLQSLVDALARRIGEQNIILSAKGVEVSEGFEVRYNGTEVIAAETVVTTCGAYALSEVLPSIPSELITPITTLEYAPVVQVSVGVRCKEDNLRMAFGGLFPSKEERGVLGILFPSDCFVDRAPQGGKLYSFFLGGKRNPELVNKSEEEIKEYVKSLMQSLLNSSTIDVIKVFKHPRAIPQYTETSAARFSAIDTIEAQHPGLIIAGNLKGGIGMADRVKQGCDIAQRIVGMLG